MKILEKISTSALPKPKRVMPRIYRAYDLIIVGGGPAGLTAAIYASRYGLKTLLIEKAILGGQISTAYRIENYPGFPEGIAGMDLVLRLEEQARIYGAQVLYGIVNKIEFVKKELHVLVDDMNIKAKSIILAPGVEPRKLNVPGEAELRGRGISYCATCDGPFYRDKNILVVGGGNTAAEEALFLTRYAKNISIIHRRDKLRADAVLAHRVAANPKIFVYWNSEIQEIIGKEKVESAVLKNTLTEKISTVNIDGLFIYVGSRPQTGFLKGSVNLDENGFIITFGRLTTSQKGVFVAGDVRQKPLRQIVTAAADGAMAADEARKFIEENK